MPTIHLEEDLQLLVGELSNHPAQTIYVEPGRADQFYQGRRCLIRRILRDNAIQGLGLAP